MSEGEGQNQLPSEARARKLIDEQLVQAGWAVQDKKDLNVYAGQGVAVREVVMKPGHGRVDYLLYIDKAVVGAALAEFEAVAAALEASAAATAQANT